MKRTSRIAVTVLVALTASVPALAGRIRRGPTSPKAFKSSSKPAKTPKVKASAKLAGPRSMDDGRAAQIQSALIKAGYLSGAPSGHWDSTSQAAMEKLQGDNGWQTKLVPDARALTKLGLGPGQEAPAATAPAPGSNE